MDLTHLFITVLHIRKDIAYETASTIITARQRLIQPKLARVSSSDRSIDDSLESKTYLSEEDDDRSISSGIISNEDSGSIFSENSDDNQRRDQNHFPKIINGKNRQFRSNKDGDSSDSHSIMNRITSYLSEVDWRVYNYITKHFLQNGSSACATNRSKRLFILNLSISR